MYVQWARILMYGRKRLELEYLEVKDENLMFRRTRARNPMLIKKGTEFQCLEGQCLEVQLL